MKNYLPFPKKQKQHQHGLHCVSELELDESSTKNAGIFPEVFLCDEEEKKKRKNNGKLR